MKMSHKIAAFIPFILGFVVFAPTLFFDFLNWDDMDFIVKNPLIKDLSRNGIIRIFSTPEANANYSPLVLLSWAINYELYGLNAFSFHLTDVILHALNGFLCFSIIYRLSKDKNLALFVSIFFAIHPLAVEPVAWLTGRKDNLYVFFQLLAILFYLKNKINPSRIKKVLIILFFGCALLSKTVAITFPFLLIIIDLYQGEKLKNAIKTKWFYLFIALTFMIWAFWAQKTGGAMNDTHLVPWHEKLVMAFANLPLLLLKTIFPFGLSPFHPRIIVWHDYLFSLISIVGLIILMRYAIKQKFKLNLISLGILWFLIVILPVAQFIPIGMAQYSDRYAYLAIIGVAIPSYILISKIRYTFIISIAIFIGFTLLNFNYQPVWKNSETLWSRVISDYPNSEVGYNNLANTYKSKGSYKEAIDLYYEAAKKTNNPFKTLNNIGFELNKMNLPDSALLFLKRSMSINDQYAGVYLNMGNAYYTKQVYDSALIYYYKSIELAPNQKSPHMNIGLLLNRKKQYREATFHFTEYLKKYTRNANTYNARGNAYIALNLEDFALTDLQRARYLNPKLPEVHYNIGVILMRRKKFNQAIPYFEQELKLNINNPNSKLNIGVCLMNLGEFQKAISVFDLIAKEYPNWPLVYENRAVAYKQIGNDELAQKDLNNKLRLINKRE